MQPYCPSILYTLVFAAFIASPQPSLADGRAALLRSGLPGSDSSLVNALAKELTASGYKVSKIGFDALCDPARLKSDKIDLLVIPEAASLPARAGATIDRYLRQGGDIIALGAPMWQQSLLYVNGKWMTRQQCQQACAVTKPVHLVANFTPKSIEGWTWYSDDAQRKTVHETIANGPAPGKRALHVWTENLSGWDMFGPGLVQNPFPPGYTLTAFSAKGGENTPEMCVEWRENDGSRWIATVGLSNKWQDYILFPEDFVYHTGGKGRGGSADHLRPENAEGTSIGVAQGITAVDGTRPQEFWVGPYGIAEGPSELLSATDARIPIFDQLSPGYKLFDCHGVKSISTRSDQLVLGKASFEVPALVRSPHARPRGVGFDKGRQWRCLPVLEARTAKNEWRGTPATLMLHFDGDFKGSAWASFGIADSKWYRSPKAIKAIGQVARKMRDGVFLIDGGSDLFTYFEDQPLRLGLRIGNIGSMEASELTARITLTDNDTHKVILRKTSNVTVAPNGLVSISDNYHPKRWPQNGFSVTAELLRDGKVIDKLSHNAMVWKQSKTKHFVTTSNGQFMLDGKPWKAHGVNYMASSCVANEDFDFFHCWPSAEHYDPEIIQRDLDHIKNLGFNSVSIFFFDQDRRAENILDFFRRLDKLGMKANISIRPSTPKNYEWEPIKRAIEHFRIPENDVVFAHDIDWEPIWGGRSARGAWDGEWEKWVIERYGSIISAEKDWGHPIPRTADGKVTNPEDKHLEADGQWRVMVAAYRRFLDTLLYKKYGDARRLLKGVDPNHMVSFRMTDGGNPTLKSGGHLTYDFPYLAAALDFLSPEAYGRMGNWERVAPGWFEFEYARWAKPEAPMIWAEAGQNTWNPREMKLSTTREKRAIEFYDSMYKMVTLSGASGIFCWYYPGGYRVDEKSDYGIINPDGSDRPVTKIIREWGPKFINSPSARPVTQWIETDRDKHPNGVAGIYDAAKDEFWNAINSKKVPGLRTAGTGTDSSNCPLIAVGNTPCNGTNPPKYLDGAFDSVEVLDKNSNWVQVNRGEKVSVKSDAPIVARVSLTNLGEAKWNAHGLGAVSLVAGNERTAIPASVQHLGSLTVTNVKLTRAGTQLPTEITLTLDAQGRTPFGEKYRIALSE